MKKTTKARPTKDWNLEAGANLRRAWGRDGKTMMALLRGGEGEVSTWLVSQGRESDSPLTPEDLVPLLTATRNPPISVRFWWALSLARASAVCSVEGISPTGDVTVRSRRSLRPKLPDIVKVSRVGADLYAAVVRKLDAFSVRIPEEMRTAAVARTVSTGKPHPHSEDARKAMVRRERRRAEKAGLSASLPKRGKPGRRRKPGQKAPPR